MSTPCYYCELPDPQSCKVCIHGEADSEELQKNAGRIQELERQLAQCIEGMWRRLLWVAVLGSAVQVFAIVLVIVAGGNK